MRAERMLALAALTVACAACQSFVRPEGDGGPTRAERRQDVHEIGVAAGVTLPDAERPLEPARPAGPLGLAEALERAEQGNRRIAEAREELAATAEQVADVRGRLLPATTAQARFTRYSDEQTTNVQFSGELPPGFSIPVVRVREIDEGTARSTVNIPLDVTGELQHALAAAQAGYRGEAARFWAVTLEQQLEVVQAYFRLLEAQRLREVSKETIALYTQQLQNARQRYDSGRLTRNEVLVVEVAMANAQQELLARELAIADARWRLNRLVGLDVDQPTEISDVRFRPSLPATNDALRQAYDSNPMLTALLEEEKRLEETETSLERSRFPSFSGGGQMDWTSSDLLQPPLIGSGFVGLTWDLGTDLRREARIAQARIDIQRNRQTLQAQMREIEAAVRATRQAAEERLAAYKTAEVAVGQAEENLRIRAQQFDAGRAESEDVLIAETLLANQRATLATALYQAHIQRAALQRLMGLSLEEVATPPIQGRS